LPFVLKMTPRGTHVASTVGTAIDRGHCVFNKEGEIMANRVSAAVLALGVAGAALAGALQETPISGARNHTELEISDNGGIEREESATHPERRESVSSTEARKHAEQVDFECRPPDRKVAS
jgi:hypothetical protein